MVLKYNISKFQKIRFRITALLKKKEKGLVCLPNHSIFYRELDF